MDHARNACSESIFVLEYWCFQSPGWTSISLDEKTSNLACVLQFGPNKQKIGNWTICDPSFGSFEVKNALLGIQTGSPALQGRCRGLALSTQTRRPFRPWLKQVRTGPFVPGFQIH